MRKVFVIALVFICQLTVHAKNHTTLTQKFQGWFKQQQNGIISQLDQATVEKNSIEKSMKGLEEKLSLLSASNSSIKTRLPLLKKLNSYKEELNKLDQKITEEQNKLQNIKLSDFSESNDFQSWMNNLEGLTTAEKMLVEEEVKQAGELQESIESLTELLANNDLTWEEFAGASNWDELWLEGNGEEAKALEATVAKIVSLQNQVKNIDMTAIMDEASFGKLATITTNQLGVVDITTLTTPLENGFNLEDAVNRLQKEKTAALQAVTKNYKVKEVDGEEVKELILTKKPELKELMFVETDVTVLRSNRSLVNVSSLLGLQMSEKFSFGLGTSYQNMDGLNQQLSGLWSGRLMTRMNVWKDIVALQVEGLSTLPGLSKGLSDGNEWNFTQLVGTRLNMPADSKMPLNMTFLRSLTGKSTSPAYIAPWQMKLGILF